MNIRRIEIVPYDPIWPRLFSEERELLLSRLPTPIAGVHHIGSTSVQGLDAKPIIDILIEVADVQELDQYSQCFESLGYECKGEFGISGRRYYQKGGDNRTHQIHAFGTASENIVRHIAFREYLAAHPAVARVYGALKKEVAVSCNNDIGLYCDGKEDFIVKHEKLALKWWRNAQPSQ